MNSGYCELWYRPPTGGRWTRLFAGTYSECVERGTAEGSARGEYWFKDQFAEKVERYNLFAGVAE